MVEDTSIKINKETRQLLNSFKIHPRQSYDEIIINLIKFRLSKRDKL